MPVLLSISRITEPPLPIIADANCLGTLYCTVVHLDVTICRDFLSLSSFVSSYNAIIDKFIFRKNR